MKTLTLSQPGEPVSVLLKGDTKSLKGTTEDTEDRPFSFRVFWLRYLMLVALLLLGREEAFGAGGSVSQKLGSVIPNSSVPGGYHLASLKVIIEPAEARTAGATWLLKGGTSPMTSGTALFFLVPGDGNHVLQPSTVTGFQAPIQPRITLTAGFETDVTFTYARTVPPVLPATASASGTRGVDFAYTPRVTGGTATSFTMTVGGGETPTTLGLALNSTTGRLSGTPAKTGVFSLAITASNAVGKSEPMTLTLTVVDPGQLTIHADAERGSVSVSPNQSNFLYAPTDTVKLTAKPKTPSFFFDGWQFTGTTPTSLTSPTTTFSFSPAQLTVVATPSFIPNPYLARADTYTGRIASASGVALANTGTLTITLTTLGQYTGSLKFGAGSYSFKGQFLNHGTTAPVTIKRAGQSPPLANLTIDQLQFDVAGGETITGRIAADVPILFTLDRTVFDATSHPCPQSATDPKTGKPATASYTLVLQRDSAKAPNLFPQGHGAGVVTVKPDSTVRFAGSLGDGTALTQSSAISRTGKWPFHALLYHNGGVLTGDLAFPAIASTSDFAGTLDWIKPPLTGATVTYPAGFTTRTGVLGSRYDKTVPVPSGTLKFGEGNLAVVLSPITVTSAASSLIASPAVPGFSLQLTAATGLFKGTLPTAAASKSLKFQGVIFQKTQRGYGWFIGPALPAGQGLPTGYVEFATP